MNKKEQNKINRNINKGFFLGHGLITIHIFFLANFISQIICSEPLLLFLFFSLFCSTLFHFIIFVVALFKKVLPFPFKGKNQFLIFCAETLGN